VNAAGLHPSGIAHHLRTCTDYFTIFVNPKVSGVVIPRNLYDREYVALHIGDGLQRPIIDLKFDDYGIWGTLSYGGAPFETLIPWHSIFVIEADNVFVNWRDLSKVEAGPLPSHFPGRTSEGVSKDERAQWWCPRRQRTTNDCDKYSCVGAACLYDTRPKSVSAEIRGGFVGDNYDVARRAATRKRRERQLHVIDGGKKDEG
jgi:hypothetical protein